MDYKRIEKAKLLIDELNKDNKLKDKKTILSFWGAPSAGKSTISARIFSYVKQAHRDIRVEYVQEWAKDLTYEKNSRILQNQLLVTGGQINRIARTLPNVDLVITDSHPYLGHVYDPAISISIIAHTINQTYNKRKNVKEVAVFLPFNEERYQSYGRTQSVAQCQYLNNKIESALAFLKLNKQIEIKDLERIPLYKI